MKRTLRLSILVLGLFLFGGIAYLHLQAKEPKEKKTPVLQQKIPTHFLGNLKVDPREGWLHLSFSYLSTSGEMAPNLAIHHHSNAKNMGSLGKGWFILADSRVEMQKDKKHIILTGPDQNIITFEESSPGKYTSKTGPLMEITAGEKGYLLAGKESYLQSFSKEGRLQKISKGKGYLEFTWASDRLVQMVDHLGRFIRFSYKGDSLHQATDYAGRTLTFERDKEKRLTGIIDSEERSHFFQYDKGNHLTNINNDAIRIGWNKGDQVASIEGTQHSPTYYNYFTSQKPDFRLVTEQADSMGNVTYYQYSKDERTISIMDPLGRSTVYYMNERYLPSMVIHPGYRVYRFKYDDKYQLTELTDPENRKTQFHYDENRNVLSITRPDGSSVNFTYDSQGNLKVMGLPKGQQYTFDYDQKGSLISSVTPEGLKTLYDYDSYGNLASKSNNRGLKEKYTYNPQGKLLSLQRGDLKIHYSYSEQGRRITLKNNLGMTLSARVNFQGQLEEYTDPRGKKIRYAYTPQGMLKSILYPNGAFTSFGYDNQGNMSSLIDPAGRVYAFGYDAVGRQISMMDPTGQSTKIAFNKMDLEATTTLPNGDEINSSYDKLGRLVKRMSPKITDNFAYDLRGNLQSMENKDGAYEFSYDELDRPTMLYDKNLKEKLVYTYNSQGLRETMTGPFGTIRYGYDQSGRLSKVVGPKGETVRYSYNSQSLPSRVSFPNGVTTLYDYDTLGRLLSLITSQKSGKVILKRLYSYDKNSNRSQVVNEKNETTKYSYDLRGQLMNVATSGNKIDYQYDNGGNRVSTKGQRIRYRYDNTGNRIALKQGLTTTYAYDESGRIVMKGKIRYLYDKLGNLTSKILPQGRVNYSYDSNNKLRSAKLKNGETIEFGYASNGARVFKKSGGSTTRYLYDFEDVVAEFKDGKMVAYYLHGPGIDEPLGLYSLGKKPRYYHTDGLGSVSALTDKSGEVSAQYAYGPFGEIIQEWGFADDNPYRFSGRWFDKETGLYYYRSRYYDPEDGRFTTQDPMLFGGGINLYAYVGNNPTNYIDPFGTKQSLWGFMKDVGSGVGLLAGIGPKDEIKAMREGFVDGLFSKQTLTNTVAFGRGFGKGVWSGVKGVYTTVRHPIQTGKAIYNAIENFDETKAAIGRLIDEYVDAAYNDPERFAEMTGQLTGEIVFAVAGTKGLDKLGKLSAISKLKGMAKVGALNNVNRLSRFASVVKLSKVGKTVARLAPAARFLAKGYQKIGGAYINAAGRKVAPWVGKKLKDMGRGYWNFSKKAAVPTIVAFNDRIDEAVKTYGDYDTASSTLNSNVKDAIKNLKGSKVSTGEAEKILRDIDTSFDNYRDYLYKPVHDADMVLKNKLDELAEIANRGEIPDNTTESRLQKFLFEEHPRMRLKALEEVYLKNKPAEGSSYVNSDGTVNTPSKNRLATYDHQIQLYNHLRDNTNDPKLKEGIDYRIRELESRKEADYKNFLDDKNVDLGEGGMSDGPEVTTPGALEKLEELDK